MTKDKRRPTVKLVADAVIDERVVSGKKWVRFEARGLVFQARAMPDRHYVIRVVASVVPTILEGVSGFPTAFRQWVVCAEDLRARASLVDPE